MLIDLEDHWTASNTVTMSCQVSAKLFKYSHAACYVSL